MKAEAPSTPRYLYTNGDKLVLCERLWKAGLLDSVNVSLHKHESDVPCLLETIAFLPYRFPVRLRVEREFYAESVKSELDRGPALPNVSVVLWDIDQCKVENEDRFILTDADKPTRHYTGAWRKHIEGDADA